MIITFLIIIKDIMNNQYIASILTSNHDIELINEYIKKNPRDVILDCTNQQINPLLSTSNWESGKIYSVIDYSKTFYFKEEIKQEIPFVKIIGLDSNVVGNINLYMDKKSSLLRDGESVIKDLENDNKSILDIFPYLLEINLNEHKKENELYKKSIKNFFEFDKLRFNNSQTLIEVENKVNNTLNITQEMEKNLKYYKELYFIFLSLVIKSFLIKSDKNLNNEKKKIQYFLDFYSKNIPILLENELILLKEYLTNKQGLNRFFRLNENTSSITKEKRKSKLQKLQGTAWDLVMIRLSEDMLAKHNRGSIEGIKLYYFCTMDKGLSQAINSNQIEKMVLCDGIANVKRIKTIDSEFSNEYKEILNNKISNTVDYEELTRELIEQLL